MATRLTRVRLLPAESVSSRDAIGRVIRILPSASSRFTVTRSGAPSAVPRLASVTVTRSAFRHPTIGKAGICDGKTRRRRRHQSRQRCAVRRDALDHREAYAGQNGPADNHPDGCLQPAPSAAVSRNPFAGRRVHAVEQFTARVGVPDLVGRHLVAAMRTFHKNRVVSRQRWHRKAVAASGAYADAGFGLGLLGLADPAELSATGRKISSHLWQAIRTFWPAFAAASSIP
ncbi:MAG: hypothetical protein CM15mP115_17590 [Alphaproteobacteria bacterium]|nr:MAG: hypothetical protein CM15mP115_17590 [Alphaproteobacteria bacterium]